MNELTKREVYQAIFDILRSVIEEQNRYMAHLFMDLWFDVICVFEKIFGPTPPVVKGQGHKLVGKTGDIAEFRIEIARLWTKDLGETAGLLHQPCRGISAPALID
jgi:hypothetical protein